MLTKEAYAQEIMTYQSKILDLQHCVGSLKEQVESRDQELEKLRGELEEAVKIVRFYAEDADWEDGFQECGNKAITFLRSLEDEGKP